MPNSSECLATPALRIPGNRRQCPVENPSGARELEWNMTRSQLRRVNAEVARRHSLTGLPRALAPLSVLVAGLMALPSAAVAQQWVFNPEVEIGVQYIDNPRLIENGDTDNQTGGLLDIGAAFRRNTQTSSLLFRPTAAIFRYADDSDLDSERYSADFNATSRGQRSDWRFLGNFNQQEVFRGERTFADIDEEPGLDDSDQTGTGRTSERRQRDMWRLRPGFTFDFTERTGFKVDVNYLDVRYDTEEDGEAVDYTNGRVDAAIVRALTPDSSLEFGVFATKYEPDSFSRPETDGTGARIRYEKRVTDISTFFIDVGAQDSEIESTDPLQADISETSFLWNIGYARRLERTRWRFDFGQNVTPSGSGRMVERDLYRAIMSHQLKPRWLLELSAVALNSDSLGGEDLVTTSDRDYLQGRATLGYQLTRSWTVESRYSLTHQDFEDTPGDAQEHEVRLSLVYRPPVPTS
jgi:opacity protein-like surface antigen